MVFNPNLSYGDQLNNTQLTDIFKCSPQGGMRKSNKTNTLALISDHTQKYYDDRWEGDIFYYTGMGLEGDQKIDYMQNKTLSESNNNNVDLFLLEVNTPKIYTFIGKVELADKPFKEYQPDKNNNRRTVWIFPLKLSNKIIPFEEYINKQKLEEKNISTLSAEEIEEKAKNANETPTKRNILSIAYERNTSVSEFAKLRANGKCQLCKNEAPFFTKDNKPYLESHHIIWLSEGGEDTIYNTAALCPNCHRKMHVLNLELDKEYLKNKIINL